MIAPATDEVRRIVGHYRDTGELRLPELADACLRSVTTGALQAEIERRGEVERHEVEVVEVGVYRGGGEGVAALTLHGSIDLAGLDEGTLAVLEVRRAG